MSKERKDFHSEIPSLDLHGLTVRVAEIEIDHFLLKNINSGFEKVKIIHGWGTGTIERVIGDYLKTHGDVKKITPTPGRAEWLVELNL